MKEPESSRSRSAYAGSTMQKPPLFQPKLLTTLKHYDKTKFVNDLIAGLIVAITKRMAQLIEEDEIVHHVGAEVIAAFYNLQSGKVEWL